MRLSPVIAGLDFYYPVLIDCDMEWSTMPDNLEGEKPERFYDSGLRLTEDATREKITIAACLFSAGQKIKENKIFEFKASYLIAVSHASGRDILHRAERKKLLEEMASTAAWPLFRSLFAHMASQTNLELPLLPNLPKLRWLKQEEDTAKASAQSD
jgi:hypothetical protein